MAEVKNSTIDLLTRQMPDTRKRDEKAVDGFSGFKTMLKSKNQKKDGGNAESKEPGDTKEDAVVDSSAAAILAAAGTLEAQNQEDMLRLMGQGLVQKLMEDPVTDKIQGVMPEEGEKAQVMDPFQALNQLRFQNLTENPGQEAAFKEDTVSALLQEAKGKISNADLTDGMMVKTNHKESSEQVKILSSEILGQAEGTGSGQEGEKGILEAIQLKRTSEAVPVRKEEAAAVPVQRENLEKKTAFTEEDEKKQEKNPEIIHESTHAPSHSLHIQPKKDEIVYTTVNAENLEDLETKLSEQILKQIRVGRGELDVQLEPYNLGKIRIKVSYEDNQVSVSVLCSESKTLKLLAQSAGELGSILENNLERPVQILVDKQGADYLNNQKEQGSGQEQHQPQHENRKEENREDFIQKLRLGILDAGNTEDSERR